MKKWEYKVMSIADYSNMETCCETLGKDGWEMVNFIQREDAGFMMMFRKEIPEPEPQWEFRAVEVSGFGSFGSGLSDMGQHGWEIVTADVSLLRAVMKRKLTATK